MVLFYEDCVCCVDLFDMFNKYFVSLVQLVYCCHKLVDMAFIVRHVHVKVVERGCDVFRQYHDVCFVIPRLYRIDLLCDL